MTPSHPLHSRLVTLAMTFVSALLLVIVTGTTLHAQTNDRGEFPAYAGGLVYPPETMARLRHIADSLQVRFRSCALDRVYRTSRQARGVFMRFEGDRSGVKKVLAALDARATPDELTARFGKLVTTKPTPLVAMEDSATSYDDDGRFLQYVLIPFDDGWTPLTPEKGALGHKGGWVYDAALETAYGEPYIRAFYFEEEPATIALPDSYARLVQYVDCLVDTTTSTRSRSSYERPEIPSELSSLIARLRELMRFAGRPEPPKWDEKLSRDSLDRLYAAHNARYREWIRQRDAHWGSLVAARSDLRELLVSTAWRAIAEGYSTEELELWVALCDDPSLTLDLKRSRTVVGSCSMDDSPRRHALEIAELSAHATRWDVFMRAHLDILNDRFERVSDGSYAWEQRDTYLRELEALDIDVEDLLIGSSLAVENVAANHYFGSIGRLGRALTESSTREQFEEHVLGMMADEALDDFNRARLFLLYTSYLYHLDTKTFGEKVIALRERASSLPPYIATFIERHDWSREE
jgi:hypothetical protein